MPHRNRPQRIEPGPGQESVWDYPRPPRLAPDARRVRVLAPDGSTLADTTSAVRVLETASPPTFYLPPDDIELDALSRTRDRSFCEWKGAATYWTLSNGSVDRAIAWGYENPTPSFVSITDWLAFYPGRVACFVGDERVRPQDGDFYGGWVTDEIVGPYKGEPGTGFW